MAYSGPDGSAADGPEVLVPRFVGNEAVPNGVSTITVPSVAEPVGKRVSVVIASPVYPIVHVRVATGPVKLLVAGVRMNVTPTLSVVVLIVVTVGPLMYGADTVML